MPTMPKGPISGFRSFCHPLPLNRSLGSDRSSYGCQAVLGSVAWTAGGPIRSHSSGEGKLLPSHASMLSERWFRVAGRHIGRRPV
jgi:hypothetical protein